MIAGAPKRMKAYSFGGLVLLLTFMVGLAAASILACNWPTDVLVVGRWRRVGVA